MQFLINFENAPVNTPAYQHTNQAAPDDDEPVEGDWGDEDDEDFDDIAEAREDLRDVSEGANQDEPTPEDDDHLPDDDLQ